MGHTKYHSLSSNALCFALLFVACLGRETRVKRRRRRYTRERIKRFALCLSLFVVFLLSHHIESLPPYKFDITIVSERERDQFKESDDESERSCGEEKKNNNTKKMGKRELAQIIT